MTSFAQPRDRLEPAVDLFDPFALALTDGVARMAGGARVDDAGPLARDMWRHLMRAQLQDKFLVVIAFVGAQGYPLPAFDSFHQLERRLDFGAAGGLSYAAAHRQPITIFHQHVTGIAELGFLARPFAGQPRCGISSG